MFAIRIRHGRVLHSPCFTLRNQRSPFSTTLHWSAVPPPSPSSKYVDKSFLQPVGPIAEQLAATRVWYSRSTATGAAKKSTTRKSRSDPSGDRARVNIVGQKLCDDVLSYVGHSLERHRGCDILDLYPGAGLWSKTLSDFLQPRSHILLEPDADLYRPFLQPLLDRPGTKLVPKSGIIWRELNSVLNPEFLPHQSIAENPRVRNDTLLVTANLAFHPKKRFLTFESIASLILHQFVHSIRTSALFQRYGLVRILIWTRTDDKLSFLPRNIQRRKRQAIDNDLCCEWVHEICGGEAASSSWFVRDNALDDASLRWAIEKMEAAGLKMPHGRGTVGFTEGMRAYKAEEPAAQPGVEIPTFKRPYQAALAGLKAAQAAGELDNNPADAKAMNIYRWRSNADATKATRLRDFAEKLTSTKAIMASKRSFDTRKADAKLEWNTEVQQCSNTFLDEFITYSNNMHGFYSNPSMLQWDRREFEPMAVEAEEFFPNIHCSLLDIQPKMPHHLLCETGLDSNRAGSLFDLILGSLMHQSAQPLTAGLESLWPGASKYILPRWTSVQDLTRGGFSLDLRCAEPIPRLLSVAQLEELITLWMEWPFRPKFNELVGRTSHDFEDKPDEMTNSAE